MVSDGAEVIIARESLGFFPGACAGNGNTAVDRLAASTCPAKF